MPNLPDKKPYYFFGEDQYEIDAAIAKLMADKKAIAQGVEAGEIIKDRSWRDKLTAGPGLFQKEIIVLRDVAKLPVAYQAELAELLKKGINSDLIMWDTTSPDKRTALFKALKKYSDLKEFTYPDDQQMMGRINDIVKQQMGAIEPGAAQVLLERVGKNGWRLRSEIARLLLQSDTITKALVEQEIPPTPQAEIFRTIEAIAAGKGQQALQQVTDLLQTGQSEFYILSMMAYQFKTLYLVKTGQGGDAKLHPYVIQKSEPLARRFSANQLLDILTRILAVDVAIKQGKMEPRTGLTMTILGLVGATA